MPDQFSPPLSEAASALVAGAPLLWEFRLFAQVLMDEIGYLKPAPVVATHHEQGFQEGAAWLAAQLQRLNDISEAVTDCLNADHLDAWGLPGESGDAQAVVSLARKVAAFHRQTLEWGSAVRQADLHPLLQPVAREESRFIEPLIGPLRDLGPNIMRQCDAIATLPPGTSATIEVNVVFDGFDRSRHSEACKRANAAFSRRRS
jgi:hypothetical protein